MWLNSFDTLCRKPRIVDRYLIHNPMHYYYSSISNVILPFSRFNTLIFLGRGVFNYQGVDTLLFLGIGIYSYLGVQRVCYRFFLYIVGKNIIILKYFLYKNKFSLSTIILLKSTHFHHHVHLLIDCLILIVNRNRVLQVLQFPLSIYLEELFDRQESTTLPNKHLVLLQFYIDSLTPKLVNPLSLPHEQPDEFVFICTSLNQFGDLHVDLIPRGWDVYSLPFRQIRDQHFQLVDVLLLFLGCLTRFM